jgi:hypothetical protein
MASALNLAVKPLPPDRAQRGVALIVFLLVLLVGSSVFLIDHAQSSVNAELKRQARSTTALAAAKAALIAYAVQDANRPGSLPCPDADYDGQSALADYGTPIVGCVSRLGWLPYQTLDMQEVRDASGARLWYAVSDNYRANSSVALNSETIGGLSVDGGPTDIVAVILSPGAAHSDVLATDPDETQLWPGENEAHDASTDLVQFLEGINADGDLNTYASSAAVSFNDRLMVITRAELMRAVEKRVAGELLGSLQAFRDTQGVFPWPVPFTDPRIGIAPENDYTSDEYLDDLNYRVTTEGLIPMHGAVGEEFDTAFQVNWSNVTAADTFLSDPSGMNTLTVANVTSGPLAGVLVPETNGTCTWTTASAVDCAGTSDPIPLGLTTLFVPNDVSSSTRTYFFITINFEGTSEAAPPGGGSARTRIVNSAVPQNISTGAFWFVFDQVVAGGVRYVSIAVLFPNAATTGTVSVSNINYYLDSATELPSWFVANNWHHLSYYTVAANYLGGGDSDCVGSATCLSLEVDGPTIVATNVGIAVTAAGATVGVQDRGTGSADLADYFEDEDAEPDNLLGATVSYRPRGDAGNNDVVRIVRAGEL